MHRQQAASISRSNAANGRFVVTRFLQRVELTTLSQLTKKSQIRDGRLTTREFRKSIVTEFTMLLLTLYLSQRRIDKENGTSE
jgi:hypothetical protein